MARKYDDLGETEVVKSTSNSSTPSRQKHIDALEYKVDKLLEENQELKKQIATLKSKPKEKVAGISQSDYEALRRELHRCYDDLVPF